MTNYKPIYVDRSVAFLSISQLTTETLNQVFPEWNWTVTNNSVTVSVKHSTFLPNFVALYTKDQDNHKHKNITFSARQNNQQTGIIDTTLAVGNIEWSIECSGHMRDWYLNQALPLYNPDIDNLIYEDDSGYVLPKISFLQTDKYRLINNSLAGVWNSVNNSKEEYNYRMQSMPTLRPIIIYTNLNANNDIVLPSINPGEKLQLSIQTSLDRGVTASPLSFNKTLNFITTPARRHVEIEWELINPTVLVDNIEINTSFDIQHYDITQLAGTTITFNSIQNLSKKWTKFTSEWANQICWDSNIQWEGTLPILDRNIVFPEFLTYLFPGWNRAWDTASIYLNNIHWKLNFTGNILPRLDLEQIQNYTFSSETLHSGVYYKRETFNAETCFTNTYVQNWHTITPIKGWINRSFSFVTSPKWLTSYFPMSGEYTESSGQDLSSWTPLTQDSVSEMSLGQGFYTTCNINAQIGLNCEENRDYNQYIVVVYWTSQDYPDQSTSN